MITSVDEEALNLVTEYITSKNPAQLNNPDVALRATKAAREDGDGDDDEDDE